MRINDPEFTSFLMKNAEQNLKYILDNAELFALWVLDNKIPENFLMTQPAILNEADITWGVKVVEDLNRDVAQSG